MNQSNCLKCEAGKWSSSDFFCPVMTECFLYSMEHIIEDSKNKTERFLTDMLPLMSDFTIVIDAPNLSGSKVSKTWLRILATDVSIKHKDQETDKKTTHN